MSESTINSLIQLLDDPDKDVYDKVKDKLLEYGATIIPKLEHVWQENDKSLIQSRVEEIIQQIQSKSLFYRLQHWVNSSQKDLLEFWVFTTQLQFPNFDRTAYTKRLSKLATEARKSIRLINGVYEKIAAFNHFLFHVNGFKGNLKNYHSPNNSCLNFVMDSRKGNPLSLSLIYIYLSKHIGLPICGINMPRHFIVGYENELMGDPVKFYINPYSKGSILSRQDLSFFLKQENIKEETKYFAPCGHVEIAKRMLSNLLYSYTFQGNKQKSKEVIKLLELFKQY